MDLEEANESGVPKWYRLYSAKKDLNMVSLRAADWAEVVDRLIDNPEFFDLFYK